jgi:diguanylate cyclase (GGDEF)-like protein
MTADQDPVDPVAQIDEMTRLGARAAVLGPVAGAIYLVLTREDLSGSMRFVWFGLLCLAALVMVVQRAWYVRVSRRDGRPSRWPLGHLAAGGIGVAWGLVTVLALPRDPRAQAITLLVLACALAPNVISIGGTLWFAVYHVPLVGIACISLALQPSATSRWLALGTVVFGLVTVDMYRFVVSQQREAQRLAGSLRTEQQATEAANDRLAAANHQLAIALEHASELARSDSLTGLANRRFLMEHLGDELAAGRTPAVVAVDLDRFKAVNDAVGHLVGDELLALVADRVRRRLPDDAFVARLGGDEFALVLPNGTTDWNATQTAERIRRALALPFAIGSTTWQLGASLGVAVAAPGESVIDVLRHADIAMYEAKRCGRDRVILFDATLRREARAQREDEHAIRLALDAGQFEAWYQPQVDLRTGRVVGAEALVRWRHPLRGVVPPAAFVPTAEKGQLIIDLTAAVARDAIATRRRLAVAGCPDAFQMSINFPAPALRSQHRVRAFVDSLERAGTDPAWFTMEITETAILEDLPSAQDAIGVARDAGVGVSLDDFGTGFSSLSLVRNLDVTELKVDTSFIRNVDADTADAAVVRAVADLASRLDLQLVAEGVEVESQRSALVGMDVSLGQGFLFSPAVTEDRFAQLLRSPSWPVNAGSAP